jgi:stearoyl-CoA desaturase (delta-9 desaturase)
LAVGISLFVALFWAIQGGWAGPVIGVATFIVQGASYIGMNAVINGACHAIGYKNFQNTATNLRLVAWLSSGEGLHNNHHQYPASSKLSMKRGEFDPAWPVIRVLQAFSLAQPLPLPSEH